MANAQDYRNMRKYIRIGRREFEIETTELPNGIIVATVANNSIAGCTAAICWNAGSHNETQKTAGIRHYVEHHISRAALANGEFAKQLTRFGIHLDDFGDGMETYRHSVRLSLKDVTFGKLELLFPHLAAAAVNPYGIPLEQLGGEGGRVKVEHAATTDPDALDIARNASFASLFPGNRLAYPIDGTPPSITALTLESAKAFHEKYFTPKRLLVVGGGCIKHAAFKRLVEHSALAQLKPRRINTYPRPESLLNPAPAVIERDFKHSLLLLGWDTTGALDIPEDRCAIRLLLSLLTDIATAPHAMDLWNEGLVYKCDFERDAGPHYSVSFIYANCLRERIDDVHAVLNRILRYFAETPLSQRIFRECCDSLRAKMRDYAKQATEVCDELANWLLEKKPERWFENYALLRKITTQDVQRVATTYFNPDHCAVVRVIGKKPFLAA